MSYSHQDVTLEKKAVGNEAVRGRDAATPVFVVGMNGSGTTMLLDCLDNHPNLFGFKRETQLLPYILDSVDRHGDLRSDENFQRLWDSVRCIPAFRFMNGGTPPELPDDWRGVDRSAAAVIDRVFTDFARREGKRRWCEKTPMHALHIRRFARLFPCARFIHIVRDGRACAASFQRRWQYTPELTMYRWKNIVREAGRQGSDVPGRYLQIRYEDVTTDPRKWMETVCQFLEEPFVEDVLAPSRLRTFTGSLDTSIVARSPSWRKELGPEQVRRLERIGGRCLSTLGYETDYPDDDYDPPWSLRKFWLYRDYLRMGVKSLRTNDPVTRVITALRQRKTTPY